jgi:hypothetical protein
MKEELINKYMMIRTLHAGVFAGTIIDIKNDTNEYAVVTLKDARRIWSWSGAASLSELATHGSSKPEECKFPCEVETAILWGVIECITVTDKARESIKNTPTWTAHDKH